MSGTLILLMLPDNSTTLYQEGAGCYGEIIDDRAAVARHVREYDLKKACALSPQESAALIQTMLEKYEPCESPGT